MMSKNKNSHPDSVLSFALKWTPNFVEKFTAENYLPSILLLPKTPILPLFSLFLSLFPVGVIPVSAVCMCLSLYLSFYIQYIIDRDTLKHRRWLSGQPSEDQRGFGWSKSVKLIFETAIDGRSSSRKSMRMRKGCWGGLGVGVGFGVVMLDDRSSEFILSLHFTWKWATSMGLKFCVHHYEIQLTAGKCRFNINRTIHGMWS